MNYESRPTYGQPTPEDIRIFLEQEALRRQRLLEPESPVATLGNMAIGIAVGGALSPGLAMPRTEAITLELIAGTVEYADKYNQNQRLAA